MLATYIYTTAFLTFPVRCPIDLSTHAQHWIPDFFPLTLWPVSTTSLSIWGNDNSFLPVTYQITWVYSYFLSCPASNPSRNPTDCRFYTFSIDCIALPLMLPLGPIPEDLSPGSWYAVIGPLLPPVLLPQPESILLKCKLDHVVPPLRNLQQPPCSLRIKAESSQ